jgi:signal transduction histidine kinase
VAFRRKNVVFCLLVPHNSRIFNIAEIMFTLSIPVEERRNMLQRLFIAWSIALVFLAVLVIERDIFLFSDILYSFLIATLLWLFTDVGDWLIHNNAGNRFPLNLPRYIYIGIATPASSFVAYALGDFVSGRSIIATNPVRVLSWMALSTVLAYIFIWFLTQRQLHKEDQISTTHAKLRLLESQLEPHMLFNTLANLRALVVTDTTQATQMLDRIVSYMRAIVNGSRANMHPLREEFERLNDYLDLMKLRMGARLNYTLTLSPELDNHLVPPFILQPLVENAIKHGLEPLVEGGRIFIVATTDGKIVSLEVNDTGAGANKEDITNAKGFGWMQVSERLAAIYGNKAAINLISNHPYKTSARISLPYSDVEGFIK